MSTFQQVPSRKNAIRKARRKMRRRSPCGRPPESPRNLRGSFDRQEAGKHLRIRAKLRWREVVEDTSGFHVKVNRYQVEVQYTPNGADWYLARKFNAGPRASAVEVRLDLTAVTNPSPDVFRFQFTAPHGLDSNDTKVTIRGCKAPTDYNGEWVIATIVNGSTVEVTGSGTGLGVPGTLGYGQGLADLENWDPEKPHCIFKGVHKDLGYRYRVRALATDGCKSAWSAWKVLGNPGADEPPSPTAVTIQDDDRHLRVTVSWNALESDDDSDLFDDRINHFLVIISKNSDFSTTYKKHRTKGNHVSIRVLDVDENETFYARARSVAADKDKSSWIPATLAGNSDPGTPPDGVSVGTALQKTKAPKAPTGTVIIYDSSEQHRAMKWRAKVRWNEVTQDVDNADIDIDHYVVMFQKSDDGVSWTDDPRKLTVNAKDDDADLTAYTIVHSVRENWYYRAKVRAVSESSTRGAFSAYTSGSQPTAAAPPTPLNVTIYHKVKPKDRIIVDWDPPTFAPDSEIVDESVAYFQVILKKNSGTSPTFGSAYKYSKHVGATIITFKLGNSDVDDDYYAWVRTVNHDGTKSAWIPARRAGNSSDAAAAELARTSDGVPAGTIHKYDKASAPFGYVRANGATVATTTWPDLFGAIGYQHGGSGPNFVLPDHQGRHGIGAGTVVALAGNEALAEGSRSPAHTHANDDTLTQPDTDLTDTTPTLDTTAATPGYDANAVGTPSDSTAATPTGDSSPGSSNHTHGAGTLVDSGPSGKVFKAAGTTQEAAGPTHNHTITGDTSATGSAHSHGHTHGSHPHPHGHTSHSHGHDHGSHPHNHHHGPHRHGHHHGTHKHQHQHDAKSRPHLGVHYYVKAED